MGFPRRSLLAALPGLLAAAPGQATPDAWAALRQPGHLALVRHALAPGTFDPAGFRLDDCATQRNLSAEGRAQAERIGALFRSNGIAAAAVHSSQWCRCLDTAALLRLGEVRPQPLLNSFAQERDRAAPQLAALAAWIAGLDLATPAVLVTHQVVVTALSTVYPGSGEVVVMRRERDGTLTLRGRVATG